MLLWRQPGVLVALVVAAAILGIAGASAPLFLASTSTAGLAREMRSDCPEWPWPAVTNLPSQNLWEIGKMPTNRTAASVRAANPTVRAAMRRQGLADPYRVLMAQVGLLPPGVPPRLASPITLYSRPGALDHVDVLDRAGGHGVWIPDTLAARQHLRAGQSVTLSGHATRVVGLYRDLAASNIGLPAYWCTWASLIEPTFENTPPPFVLTDDADVLGAGTQVAAEWFSPVDSGRLTLPTAQRVSRRTRAVGAALASDSRGPTSTLRSQTFIDTDVNRAAAGRDGLRGPVLPVAVAGTLVALLLVGAAGGYWTERRSVEVKLLTARGVTPLALGVKAVLEMLVPAVLGLVAGWLAAIALVRWLGPSELLEPGAPVRALIAVGLAGVAGVVLLGVVAASRSRGATDRRTGGSRPVWRAVPWELALLAASALAYLRVRDHPVTLDHFLVQIPPLMVAFPLLALTGCVLLGARLSGAGMPVLRRWSARLPAAGYLASRRVTANGAVALALLVATAIPVGVLAYAATLARSADATVQAKIRTNLGADHTVVTLVPPKQTPATGGHGTVVSVFQSAVIDGDNNSGVLGVDPATFPRFAARGLASRPVGDLLALLDPTPAGQPLPAILVNAGTEPVHSVKLGRTTVPVRVVDREEAFPGVRFGPHPTLVLRRDALGGVDFYAARNEEIWTTNAQATALRDVIRAHHVPILFERTPVNVLQATDLVTVTWALGYLQALAVLAGLIAVAGLLLYLAARARARVASYVLGRRMGVSRRGHFASLVIEIGAMTSAGCVLGLLVARVAVGLVNPLLDVNPDYPPAELLTYPVGTLAGIGVALLATTAVCSLTAQRTADQTPPAAVMRLGG
ncbi:MAG TPA: FtsX-like permease family protein [Mycobacteriales bacterium]|nr:FtsX-like permease family protein [Mycobacteriales bacterium]